MVSPAASRSPGPRIWLYKRPFTVGLHECLVLLDARLSGKAAPAPAPLNPFRLVLGLIRARLAAWLGRT